MASVTATESGHELDIDSRRIHSHRPAGDGFGGGQPPGLFPGQMVTVLWFSSRRSETPPWGCSQRASTVAQMSSHGYMLHSYGQEICSDPHSDRHSDQHSPAFTQHGV